MRPGSQEQAPTCAGHMHFVRHGVAHSGWRADLVVRAACDGRHALVCIPGRAYRSMSVKVQQNLLRGIGAGVQAERVSLADDSIGCAGLQRHSSRSANEAAGIRHHVTAQHRVLSCR